MNDKSPIRRCPFEYKDRTLDEVRATATEVESMSQVKGTLWHVGNITGEVIGTDVKTGADVHETAGRILKREEDGKEFFFLF